MTATRPATPLAAPRPVATLALGAILLVLPALHAVAQTPAGCQLGTRTPHECTLSIQHPGDAHVTLPEDFTGTRSARSPLPYAGSAECPERFVVTIDGDGRWTRIRAKPGNFEVGRGFGPCDCANLEARVRVVALSPYTHCQGGCENCDDQKYCSNPKKCYMCSWTPVGLAAWPQAETSARGVWVPAGPLTGPAHCELHADLFRNSVGPSWKGANGVVAATVFDRRTGQQVPVVVEVRRSDQDPGVTGSGCPHCPN